jgi:hypothetical protein
MLTGRMILNAISVTSFCVVCSCTARAHSIFATVLTVGSDLRVGVNVRWSRPEIMKSLIPFVMDWTGIMRSKIAPN